MANVEHEQVELVKEELAKLKAALKKQEQQVLQQEPTSKHEVKELFVKVHKEKDLITTKNRNTDKDGTSEQHHSTLDVSPGDHTVVEL